MYIQAVTMVKQPGAILAQDTYIILRWDSLS